MVSIKQVYTQINIGILDPNIYLMTVKENQLITTIAFMGLVSYFRKTITR